MRATVGEENETVQIGLLLEAAQTQQRLAESGLTALQSHLRGLDAVVRDEIRETLVTELAGMVAESGRVVAALRRLRRAVDLRTAGWSIVLTSVPPLICTAVLWRWMPSAAELAARRAQQIELEASVAQLQREGGRVELRRCGGSRRLCVRVDERAGAFGTSGEFRIISGY